METIKYAEFKYQPTAIKNEFEIRPHKDQYGEVVVMEDKIATINPSRFDAEKHAKLLAAAPELLEALLEMKMQLIQWSNQEEGTIGKQWADKALAAIQKATE